MDPYSANSASRDAPCERRVGDREIDRPRRSAQVAPVDDAGRLPVLVHEHVAGVQVSVAEHGLGRWWAGRLAVRQHRHPRPRCRGSCQLGQRVACPGGAIGGVGTSERIDRQVRIGGQGVQLGQEPADRRRDGEPSSAPDGDLRAPCPAGDGRPRTARAGRRRRRRAPAPGSAGSAVGASWGSRAISRSMPGSAIERRGNRNTQSSSTRTIGVVPPGGDDAHVVARKPAGPHGVPAPRPRRPPARGTTVSSPGDPNRRYPHGHAPLR